MVVGYLPLPSGVSNKMLVSAGNFKPVRLELCQSVSLKGDYTTMLYFITWVVLSVLAALVCSWLTPVEMAESSPEYHDVELVAEWYYMDKVDAQWDAALAAVWAQRDYDTLGDDVDVVMETEKVYLYGKHDLERALCMDKRNSKRSAKRIARDVAYADARTVKYSV